MGLNGFVKRFLAVLGFRTEDACGGRKWCVGCPGGKNFLDCVEDRGFQVGGFDNVRQGGSKFIDVPSYTRRLSLCVSEVCPTEVFEAIVF